MAGPILLVIGCLAIFILEVFVVSFGVLSIVGITLGILGIVLAFDHSSVFGWTMVGALVVGAPACITLAFRLLPKLPFARGFYLRPPALADRDRRAAAAAPQDLLGRVGEATSPLRPAGTARFDGEPMQVVSTGGMIPRGTRVRVVDVSGNRVVVEPADPV